MKTIYTCYKNHNMYIYVVFTTLNKVIMDIINYRYTSLYKNIINKFKII